MRAIFSIASAGVVGSLRGDVICNGRGEPCAFVRGEEVFTFTHRRVGVYAGGRFLDAGGAVVGLLVDAPAVRAPRSRRRRRFQITPRLGFSVRAPRPAMTSRPWSIWDLALDRLPG